MTTRSNSKDIGGNSQEKLDGINYVQSVDV